MSPFQLFNLPLVPLSIVLNSMSLPQLIKVALTSKRSYRISKFLSSKITEKFKIYINNFITIEFENWEIEGNVMFHVFESSEIKENFEIEFLKIRDTVIKIQKNEEDDSLHVYWDNDRFVGLQFVSNILTDFFDSSIHRLAILDQNRKDDPRKVIDWLMNRQKTLPFCYFECQKTSDEDLKYFLDTCRVSEELTLVVKTSEHFQYSFKYPMELRRVAITGWPALMNLYELNCELLWMNTRNFSNQDINSFLNNWMNGGNSIMKFLYLRVKQFDLQSILNGFEVVARRFPNPLLFNWFDGRPLYFNYGMEIRRESDGKVALIRMYEDGSFKMYVWPDWKGLPYPLDDPNQYSLENTLIIMENE
uniref:F-box domain-containing protein n=1 Tax=Caenorhabditis tropicalis TaxID=1561998 RepID=A0A1I7TER6_9PELO